MTDAESRPQTSDVPQAGLAPESAALAVIAILERESAALAVMDLDGAAALLTDKRRAVAALDHCATPNALPEALLHQLRDTVRANQTLLERALTVQGQVVSLVAGACQPQSSRYGARGALASDRAVAPRAFLARA